MFISLKCKLLWVKKEKESQHNHTLDSFYLKFFYCLVWSAWHRSKRCNLRLLCKTFFYFCALWTCSTSWQSKKILKLNFYHLLLANLWLQFWNWILKRVAMTPKVHAWRECSKGRAVQKMIWYWVWNDKIDFDWIKASLF